MSFPVGARSTGELITASIWNADLKDNINSLYTGSLAISSQAALDFLYAASATAMARLAKGTALQVPRMNAAADGWEFATIAQKVVQIVTATCDVSASSSSSTMADTGLTATITPTSSSNKVLVIVFQAGCAKSGNEWMQLQLNRGSGALIVPIEATAGYTNSTLAVRWGACGIIYLDSPATTSATTYKTRFAAANGTVGVDVQIGSVNSSIALIEVTP